MRRHHTTSADQQIGSADLFAGLTARQLRRLSAESTTLTVPAGRVLCRQGASDRELIVLLSGQALVTADGTAIAVMGAGSHIGDEAASPQGRWTSTVTTITPAEILVISAAELADLMAAIPQVAARLQPVGSPREAEAVRAVPSRGGTSVVAGRPRSKRPHRFLVSQP